MTPADIVYQRRLAVVTHAIEIGNKSEAARTFGLSRKSVHHWTGLSEMYGSDGLRPKDRRTSVQPDATPTWVIDEILRLAVTDPALGARRYTDRLADRGYAISKTTIQHVLNTHRLGRRTDRYAAAARLALFTHRSGHRRRPRRRP